MNFSAITLFPQLIEGAAKEGILGRALEEGHLSLDLIDLRPYGEGRHKTVDDTPYGGGAGMVMKVKPVVAAIEDARAAQPGNRVVLLTPGGRKFTQAVAVEYSKLPGLTLVCGRYEGFDDRISAFVDEELSLGDFVLMGGEVAALAVIEAVARLLPGVLGDPASAVEESHEGGLLEYPQYTRPRSFRGMEVPEVLLGGNHAGIAAWRNEEARRRTSQRRPDLLSDKEEGGPCGDGLKGGRQR